MRRHAAQLGMAALLMLVVSPMLNADGLGNNEVVFRGEVTGAKVSYDGSGTLFVRMSSVDLRVLINPKTQFEDDDDSPMTADALAKRVETSLVYVEVAGRFSSSGILASKVRMLESDGNDSFKVQGHITRITTSGNGTEVWLPGLKLSLTDKTVISWESIEFPLADLEKGMFVSATGKVSAEPPPTVWVVEELKVLTESRHRESLNFEGTVLSYDTGVLKVAVAGAEKINETEVLVTPATKIDGELTVGAYVRVSGVLNPGLGASATEIELIPPLELKPDDLKLKVGESAVITVSLRVEAAHDVKVDLVPSPDGTVETSPTSVTVSKKERTADFTVKGVKIGVATIAATAGTDKAGAEVKVGGSSASNDNTAANKVRLDFAPDHIKMDVGETRDVVLLIQPPQKDSVEVAIAAVDDNKTTEDERTLVRVVSDRGFSSGAANLKVRLHALAKGTALVAAQLPGDPGGATAELIVVIGSQPGVAEKPLEVSFRPSQLPMKLGEDRPVELNLSRPAPADIKLRLTQVGTALIIPENPEIKMGHTGTTIQVTAAKEGESFVTATLPALMGGGTATLRANVRK